MITLTWAIFWVALFFYSWSRSVDIFNKEQEILNYKPKGNEMKLVNLTPHTIILSDGNKTVSYPRSRTVARVDLDYTTIGELDGFPISTTRILKSNMPEPEEGYMFIVSALVLQQCKYAGRTDCVAPDSNHATRDNEGNIVSVPGWIQ